MEQETSLASPAQSDASSQLVIIARLRRQLEGLMRIDNHEIVRPPDEIVAFRGQVRGDTETAFEELSQRFADVGYTVWLRDREEGGHEVVVTKGVVKRKPGSPWVNVILLAATILVVLYIGAGYGLGDAGLLPDDISPSDALLMPLLHIYRGIPFAATLMGILLAHELSHYFVAQRYGSPVSLPYFIPFPNFLGTMGAVIVQKAYMRSRKAVFDIGIAGPLGGLIVAIPLLVLGLALSSVGQPPAELEVVVQEGNSLLYLGLKYLVFGKILPSNGQDVWLHSVAFAAWAGLLVTMINLIPVGQLDGGHVSYALLGRRAWYLGYAVIAGMIVWGGWLLMNGNQAGGLWVSWGFLNLFLNRRHPPPVNDATKLDWARVLVGLAMLVILILLFMPAPLREVVL
jgi:membrane-associated protease RseP (regulator of RpoE activity)